MILLRNRITGAEVVGEIASPIDASDVECYVTQWKPISDRKIEELKAAGNYTREGVAEHNVEDAHWEWSEKVRDRAGQLQWNSYALRCEGRTQGLMFVNMVHRCRLESQKNMHMVYIDLLATAPWNRRRLSPAPLYRGVGDTLMLEAILLSSEQEFGGRIGLHALPNAVDFYQNQWGMVCMGTDPNYHELPYFELTTEQAAEILRS
ncbi:hypothetical protein [Burkholderia gladioli]|uniref:hypothetical protein n=1 Tax=Burkholderia gladioli TaxID=28095 RepID=UPI00163EB80A|nr:hypothetical protein [Burkholderia gladioli]